MDLGGEGTLAAMFPGEYGLLTYTACLLQYNGKHLIDHKCLLKLNGEVVFYVVVVPIVLPGRVRLVAVVLVLYCGGCTGGRENIMKSKGLEPPASGSGLGLKQ